MAKTIVVPKSTIPLTREWLGTHIKLANSCAAFLKTDCEPFAKVCRELKQYKAWEVYFDDCVKRQFMAVILGLSKR